MEGDIGKEGKGSSQGTCIKDPWTKAKRGAGRIECEREAWAGEGSAMREQWVQL